MDKMNLIIEKIRSEGSSEDLSSEELENQLDLELKKADPDFDLVNELTSEILEAKGKTVKEIDVCSEIQAVKRRRIKLLGIPKWAVSICAACVLLAGLNIISVSAWGMDIISAIGDYIYGVKNGKVVTDEERQQYIDSVTENPPQLNDGNFYLNGDINNCYYTIKDGYIQLATDDVERIYAKYNAFNLSYYEARAQQGLTPGQHGGTDGDFDSYYEELCSSWAEPHPYIIDTDIGIAETSVLWDPINPTYELGINSLVYIDENTIGSGSGWNIYIRVDDDSAVPAEETSELSEPESEPKVNEGNFYLNGDVNSCYFTLKDGYMQLITDDEERVHEFYDELNLYYYTSYESFERWYAQFCVYWSEPQPYVVNRNTALGETHIIWHPYYGEDYSGGVSGPCVTYIDENSFVYGKPLTDGVLVFTRVSDDT